MDISIDINEHLFNSELESHLSRTIVGQKLGMLAHASGAGLFLWSGNWRVAVIFMIFVFFSITSLLSAKKCKAEVERNSNSISSVINKWKIHYEKERRISQVISISTIPILIISNFISGMTIQDMLHDTYTIILIPSFFFIFLLTITKGYVTLPHILEKVLD